MWCVSEMRRGTETKRGFLPNQRSSKKEGLLFSFQNVFIVEHFSKACDNFVSCFYEPFIPGRSHQEIIQICILALLGANI